MTSISASRSPGSRRGSRHTGACGRARATRSSGTSTRRRTDHDDGTIETPADGRYALRYERRLRHPVDKVSRLLWELAREDDGTRLTRTVTAEAPGDHLASVRAGRHVHFDFLADALDGRPVDWPNWPEDRWRVHLERYEASMRPIS